MSDKYFLDTNILIYSFDSKNIEKRDIACGLIKKALNEQVGCISTQVIQEFINVSYKKFNPPMENSHRQKYFNNFLVPLCEVFTSIELYRDTLELVERWRFSFYDSMIISAAIQSNCSILYSEDLQHGQNIQSLTIINPFRDL